MRTSGQYTVLFSRLVGPRGRVIGFEPVPRTFRVLKSVVEGLRLSNVSLFEVALADFDGHADVLEISDADGLPDPGLAHLSLDSPGTVEVPVSSLDSLSKTLCIGRCGFLKIDVEGAELLVLRGAERFLVTHRPTVLLELDRVMSARFAASPQQTREFLEAHGYTGEEAPAVWTGPSTVFHPTHDRRPHRL